MDNAVAIELAIWSAMGGVILTLWGVAALDLLWQRSLPAARGLAFIVLTGGSTILLSGLPETLVPSLGALTLLPLKASVGPLSGALAVTYLGVWVGAARDDPMVRWAVSAGSLFLVVAAAVLAALALSALPAHSGQVMAGAAAVNAVSVVLAAVVAIRSATLGDALARWMAAACLCLAGMVGGVYAKALHVSSPGLGLWVFAAVSTVCYFLIVIALTSLRNREMRRLARLARSATEVEWGLEMPLGPRLLPQVEDALWRSARVDRECVVAAVTISNLYALGEDLGAGVDGQILGALAARIRRVVGFRNVVGLYHPRCFVLVVSAVQDRKRGELLATRLLQSLRKPVKVGESRQSHFFSPLIGIGVVTVNGATESALAAINQAEQMALEAGHLPSGVVTRPFQAPPG